MYHRNRSVWKSIVDVQNTWYRHCWNSRGWHKSTLISSSASGHVKELLEGRSSDGSIFMWWPIWIMSHTFQWGRWLAGAQGAQMERTLVRVQALLIHTRLKSVPASLSLPSITLQVSNKNEPRQGLFAANYSVAVRLWECAQVLWYPIKVSVLRDKPSSWFTTQSCQQVLRKRRKDYSI